MTDVRKPRLLFVGAFPPEDRKVFGGNVTACRELMQSSFSERLELNLIDSTQISNPPPSLHVRLLLAVRRFVRFIISFERRRPDAVLLFVAVGASVIEKGAMARYSRIRGVPILMFPRGGRLIDICERSSFTSWWTKLAFSSARKVLCQGTKWQEFSVETLGFSRNDAPIIANWTASQALVEISKTRDVDIDSGIVRFLFLGWVDQEKGVLELLEACLNLSKSRQFTLDIVGEGNFSIMAREYVTKNELDSVIRFHGWLKGADLELMFKKTNVLVLPSWAEGLPNAMVEAMAAKLAIIATTVGNIPDVITDGVSGLLVPPRDSDALTQAFIKLADEPVVRSRIADAGNVIAKERFAVEPAVELLLSAIEQCLNSE
jgi:glycosyltransferase involved in cell wall biosynthesis